MLSGHLLAVNSLFTALILILPLLTASKAQAATANEINSNVNATLELFKSSVVGGQDFLKSAQAVLVFPNVIKKVVGASGEGALRIDGQTRQFYRTTTTSLEFQPGVQSKTILLAFTSKKALYKFRKTKAWEAGEDGLVTLIEWDETQDISVIDIEDPIIGFVFDDRGLMYNLTLKGSKFIKISR